MITGSYHGLYSCHEGVVLCTVAVDMQWLQLGDPGTCPQGHSCRVCSHASHCTV